MKNILVGLDTSRRSQVAVEQALDLAAPLNARVHLLQAIEPAGPVAPLELGTPADPLAVIDRNSAMASDPDDAPAPVKDDDDAAAAIRLCHEANVPCTYQCPHGMAPRLLREHSIAMDLLVMGRRGTTARRAVGATATAILAAPPAPVLMCREMPATVDRALLAYEPSAAGGRALKLAGSLCTELNIGLDVVVAGQGRREAARVLDQAMKVLRAYHVEGEQMQYQGKPAEALQTAALELASSIIVVPHHQSCPLVMRKPSETVRAALDFPTAMALVVP
jgi:nucleotide-binding universal stress UspA family protein